MTGFSEGYRQALLDVAAVAELAGPVAALQFVADMLPDDRAVIR